MTKIISEDFDSWRENPITQAVFRHLQNTAERAHDTWAQILSADATPDLEKVLLIRAELKGKLDFVSDMVNLELTDIQEEPDARASTVDAEYRS